MANTSGFNTCQSHSSSYEGREGEGRRREGGTAGGREEGRGEGGREPEKQEMKQSLDPTPIPHISVVVQILSLYSCTTTNTQQCQGRV